MYRKCYRCCRVVWAFNHCYCTRRISSGNQLNVKLLSRTHKCIRMCSRNIERTHEREEIKQTRVDRERARAFMSAKKIRIRLWFTLSLSWRGVSLSRPDSPDERRRAKPACVRMCACVWVCVWERESKKEKKKERERAREKERAKKRKSERES